ncbi:unnamed protein product [Clonostachys rhizophaga]|uniref:Probable dipeptidyl-aminopeptidase B n=1 Tax=Clonostachys rhizophaga TaxID=160324 RepID=A0A9N9V758_9HYPO|nr:unnamed protein product [Clonostachys rhizophaga]
MLSIEDRCLQETAVTPHWTPGGDAFWYRQKLDDEKYQFMFVHAADKIVRPAFDHKKLAKELCQKTGMDFDPHQLPFLWIEITTDGNRARFLAKGKKWEYGTELVEWDGTFKQESNSLMQVEEPSDPLSTSPVRVRFTNQTEGTLNLIWINFEGEPKHYGTIQPDEARSQETYSGHCWRLEDASSGKVKAIYRVPDTGHDAVIVNEPSPEDDAKSGDEAKIPARQDEEKTQDGEISDIKLDIQQYNLWMSETGMDGTVRTQISKNGTEEQPYDKIMVFKSPDDNFAIAWQFTPEQESSLHLLNYAPDDQLQPKLTKKQYLKPGDRVRVDRPRLFDLGTQREVETSDALFANPYQMISLGWGVKDGKPEYRFIFNERGHQLMRVLAIGLDGTVRVLIEEKSDTFINYANKLSYEVLKQSNMMIWASERDGYSHIYLVDLEKGEVRNQITQGQWNVRDVEHIDETNQQIWVSAYGFRKDEDPYHLNLVRVNFDGTGCQALTEGDGTHVWKWSPNNRFFIDTWSRVDLPPRTAVRSSETGSLQLMLHERTAQDLTENGWDPAERFSAVGRDGETLIYGIIIRPPQFDQTKRYPVLENLYSGPHDFSTPKRFESMPRLREWASQGYIVVILDGMGTNWRSKKFHDVAYKNLKDGGLPDRIVWMQEAAKTRPWMDLSRVGVMGGSAGGQNAVSALLHHGDFYKAAVADSGCHDNRLDKIWWNEQWMGYPVDESYEENSNITHAAKLRGKLMLVVGGMDTNVDPAATMRLVSKLIKEDKDHELVFIPDGSHCEGMNGPALGRMKRFFKQHLNP